MRGVLIYERAEAARNRGFIDLWMGEAKARRLQLRLCLVEEMAFGLWRNTPRVMAQGAPLQADFAVMRARQPLLSRQLEAAGMPVFNNAHTSEILNDKRRTHARFCDLAPMLDTACVTADMACPFAFPVVVKGAMGCGGRQVRLCEGEAAYRAAIREFGFQAVVQPLCDTPGMDLRLYMLGDALMQAMLRRSDGEDFRSNFGLHHRAEPVPAPPETVEIARRIAGEMGSGLIGVDFIRHGGRWLLNECEDVVGTRMLYQHTGLDPVHMYMEFILSHLV